MIVSDSEKFVFVHNPKCGGMSCHNALLQYDTRNNLFFEWREIAGTRRTLDMAHITPFQMRRFFPKVFEEVHSYVKFTFVRDPYQRYLSAVSQHLKLGTPMMRDAILNDVEAFYQVASAFAMAVLDTAKVENDHRLVHFRPQYNFVNVDSRQWVKHVFHLEEKAEALAGTPVAGWLPDLFQSKVNQTQGFGTNGYEIDRLGQAAITTLNAFYACDFETFGYDKL